MNKMIMWSSSLIYAQMKCVFMLLFPVDTKWGLLGMGVIAHR